MLRLGVEYNFVNVISIKVRVVCRYLFYLMMISVDDFLMQMLKKAKVDIYLCRR